MPRNFLAALDANTGSATSWNPDIGTPACTGCQVIRTLQVSSNTVYVGGSFQSVSGTFRRNLAAVDASTGQVVPWNPNPIAGDTYPSNGDAYSLAIQGNKIFAGGNFLGMNAQNAFERRRCSGTAKRECDELQPRSDYD